MQAYAGIVSVTGQPAGPPTRVGGSVVDFGTGMWAAIAVLSALRKRDATGEGSTLEASLLDTSLAWVSYHMMGYLATGDVPGPMGSSLGAIAPYRAFRTRDGHVMIAAGNDGIFARLCETIGLTEVAADERFATNPLRVAHRDELDRLVEERTEELDSSELLERLRRAAVPASAIHTIADVADDGQVAVTGMLGETLHPAVPGYRDLSLPLKVDGARPRADSAPPAPGQHTIEVLDGLGYSSAEIERLESMGVVEAREASRA
jgi:crotonobetainyl-CoA:carnitine CoA-transferase CaiB-like acyl-CoA transferase